MAGGFQAEDDVISGINITPLVDVVLVLLIIFMITAPVLYQSAIKVKLPSAKSGEEAQKSPLEFSITKEGDLNLGKDKIEWAQLPARLAALGPAAVDQTAVISADEATPHGTVIKLMDGLRTAGIVKFALSVQTPAPAGAASAPEPAH